jgi:long-chain acyl-CoA synthetase
MQQEATQFRQHPRRWAAEAPARPAIVMAQSGESISYGELDARANRCAHLLRNLGLQRGDHLALLIENHPRFLEIAWAAQNSGLYYTPISWRFRIDEIAFILKDCGAKVLFTTLRQSNLLVELRSRLPGIHYVVVDGDVDGCLDYGTASRELPSTPIADESRGSDMIYSSGSTGTPKGVKLELPTLGVDGLSRMFSVYAQKYGWNRETVYMMTAPLYHSGPLRFAMSMQYIGATLILMEKFDALLSLKLCEQYRVTNAHWVPTMLVRLLKLPEADRKRCDLSSIRTVIHGAAPTSPDIKRAMIEWLGPILEESYGGTEGNGLTMISSEEWLKHPGSVGRSMMGSLHILDEQGRELPPGEIGLVYFAGGPRFEYYNNPARTKAAYDAEGRSTLGDVGYLDAEGYLYLSDRRDFMAIVGGVNVFPQEAEDLLIAHPRVMDAAVFGVPDEEMGEVIHAVVQPLRPDEAGPALERELLDFCLQRIAPVKCPRRIEFREQLPRHDTGKIYKRFLKDEYLAAQTSKGAA